LDTELQDAVLIAQKGDTYAQEVLESLNDQSQSPIKWTIEEDPNGLKHLFYDRQMYIPDNLTLWRQIIMTQSQQDTWAFWLPKNPLTLLLAWSSTLYPQFCEWLRSLPTTQNL
jgi:hypothetical protein